MSKEKLDNLARIGKLNHQAPSRREFQGLLTSGIARLRDAQHRELSLESQFDLAYNAAHALALAALRWHGYRSDSRYLVFQCLQHTVDLAPAQWRVLDRAHRARNLAEYEGHMDIEVNLGEAVIRVATQVQERVAAMAWPEGP